MALERGEVLVLKELEGMSYREIAGVLEIPDGTVGSRLHHARDALRRELEAMGVGGLVRGNTIRARNLGRDVLAILRNMVGGEIGGYTKMLAESREQALDRMVEEAEALGADTVVEVRFETSQIMGAAAELLCYGTAVVTGPAEGREGGG